MIRPPPRSTRTTPSFPTRRSPIWAVTPADPANAPRWLLNLTNDAWFGDSSGPYQHFASTRIRAVEQGLPLIRAANNGISAVIDSYGRVIKKIILNDRGVIDVELPEPATGKKIGRASCRERVCQYV